MSARSPDGAFDVTFCARRAAGMLSGVRSRGKIGIMLDEAMGNIADTIPPGSFGDA